MVHVQPLKLIFRNSELEVVAENFQFVPVAQIVWSAEIVGHDEAAPPKIFSEVCNFSGVEVHEAGFGQVEKGIFEDLRTIQRYDLIRVRRYTHGRNFVHQSDDEFIRRGIVVMPRRVERVIVMPIKKWISIGARNPAKQTPAGSDQSEFAGLASVLPAL
jgi:hypothetical protein